MHHASGTFEVQMKPGTTDTLEGFAHYTFDKQLHGGLEATSKAEMISAGDPKSGHAGYVAMELVTGTLDGKAGTFILQHTASMQPSGNDMDIIVTPGSATGDLKGLTGTFKIIIEAGKHSYTFDYTLPTN